jgi:hypothetical protein
VGVEPAATVGAGAAVHAANVKLKARPVKRRQAGMLKV